MHSDRVFDFTRSSHQCLWFFSRKSHLSIFGSKWQTSLMEYVSEMPKASLLKVISPLGLKGNVPTPIAIVAKLPVKKGHGEAFEAAAQAIIPNVHHQEDGNRLYCLCKSKDATTYAFLELYTGSDAIKAHGATGYFKTFGRSIRGHLDGRPNVSQLQTVGSGCLRPTHQQSTSKL
eukprot:m.201373 g.201373  ORF g.201373 m.201373 type:complete len:175 (-) comp18803_c1_seq2:171-695(-)